MRNIDLIREVKLQAAGGWERVLPQCGVTVPAKGRHGPCAICGGFDRFHYIDDHGGGEWHCRQCDEPNHGDGLDLIARAQGITITAAAQKVASVMGVDTRMPEPKPAKEKPLRPIADRVAALMKSTHMSESVYLNNKGLQGPHSLLKDGSLLLVLRTMAGTVTGAQTIRPTGEKRLLAGTKKKGAFIPVGDIPENPDTVVITEGYATALSLDVTGPEVILAAIDAGNLLSVAQAARERWPQTPIIIAGDNDVTPEGENVGKHAAEEAARAAGCLFAVPPTDHKADWNDYRQQNGVEALQRAFMLSAVEPEIPEAEEVEQMEEKVVASTKLTVIEGGKKEKKATDPLKPRIESREEGVYWVEPKMDKDTGEIVNKEQWLCSPLEVVGIGYEDEVQYLVLRWSLMASKEQRTMAVPLADIGEREGWRALKSGGVNITTKSGLRATLADWLQRCGSRKVWRIAHATGWQWGAYIMPDGEIIGTPDQAVLFRGRSAAASGYKVKGTPESWRDNVARLVEGNPSMMTAVAAALAAPLIGLAENDGFGIHFFEQSSSGKTTTANVASSLYGNPDALRLTWYGTALGLANEASAHNDALMPLDEVGQGADPHSVSQSAYALFNGVGKLQGAKEGGNRDLKRWRTIAISTGEMDMETFIATSGRKVKAGQLVRLLNIPLSKAVCFHEHANGKQHADALKAAYQQHYGAAGREWVKYLADHQQDAVAAVRAAEVRWRSLIPAHYGEQVHRVAARFAVLEAALLLGRIMTGWDEQGCRDAIQHSYNAWVNLFGTSNKEYEQIIEQAEAFLSAFGMSRFATLDYNEQALIIPNLAGYRVCKRYGDPVLFYVLPKPFKEEMAKGFDSTQFARTLNESGRLKKPAKGKGYQTLTPRLEHLGGIQQRAYLVVQLTAEEEE